MEKRYAFVARMLSERITDGTHPVGSTLPNEFDLAALYGVSRSTVRAALDQLVSLGLVSRRRNAGTRVEASSPGTEFDDFTQTLSSIEEIQQFGSQTDREVRDVATVVADIALAKRLGCGPGTNWLRISFLRRSRGKGNLLPICWTDVYIEATFADAVRARLEAHTGIYGSLLEELSGRRLMEIDQTIRAIGMSPMQADLLESKPGNPALEFRRKYLLSPGSLAEISVSVHPADRFSYRMRVRRSAR